MEVRDLLQVRDLWKEIVSKYHNEQRRQYGVYFASDVLINPYILWLKYRGKLNNSFESQKTMCIGIAVHEFVEKNVNLEKEISLELKFKNYIIKGRLDLYDPKNKVIYEIKTCKSLEYVPHENNLCQLSLYMHKMNANYGVLVYIDKVTGEHKNVVMNECKAKKYYSKAKRYFDYVHNLLKLDEEEVIRRVKKSKFFKDTVYQLKLYNIDI